MQEKTATKKRRVHLYYLFILLPMLLLPFAISPDSGDRSLSFFGWQLPGLCMTQTMFGTSCPGCGLTRSFVYLTNGEFARSWHIHRLGLPLYAFFVLQTIYRVYCWLNPGRRLWKWVVEAQFILPLLIISGLILNWFLTLAGI